jgi:hypothetical protein
MTIKAFEMFVSLLYVIIFLCRRARNVLFYDVIDLLDVLLHFFIITHRFSLKKKILQSIRVMFLKSFRSAAKVKWEKRQSPGITLECLKS